MRTTIPPGRHRAGARAREPRPTGGIFSALEDGGVVGAAHPFTVLPREKGGGLARGAATERAGPSHTKGDAQGTRFQKSTESPPTLSELGLDKKTSAIAQKLGDTLAGRTA
jgi:hypothetical protein